MAGKIESVNADNFCAVIGNYDGYVILLLQEHERGSCAGGKGSTCGGKGMCGPIIRAVHQIAESLEAFAFPSAGFPEKGKGRNIKIAAMPIATSSVNADFARRNFDARSLPTIVLFDNGVQIGDIFTKGDLMDQNALALQVVENKGLRPALVSMIERWFCRQIETPAGTRKTIVRSPEGIILPFDPR